jgi:hypothetical protein
MAAPTLDAILCKQRIGIHLEATRSPMLSDEALDELAEDIKSHGLRIPLCFWRRARKRRGR